MTKIILHRGLCNGPDPSLENNPKWINSIIDDFDYDFEVDLWRKNGDLYLGHSKPKYKINLDFFVENRDKLWIHCKNINALEYMVHSIINLNYFWHDKDEHTLTSRKFIWQEGYHNLTPKTIVVDKSKNPDYNAKCYGICCDFVK